MEWLKVSSRMSQDLAVRRLNDREFRDWIRLLELCAYHETDGRFNAVDAKLEGVRPASLTTLTGHGLLTKNGSGYLVANWSKYQKSREQIQAERASNRKRAAAWREKA